MVQCSTHYQIYISYILSIHYIEFKFSLEIIFLNNFIEFGMSFHNLPPLNLIDLWPRVVFFRST